jgi:DNA-binding LytR/AlgR family response regulator
MNQLNCIIIEDEPLATEILAGYIKQLPALTLVHTFEDAVSAMDTIQSHRIDLIFLDIHLPLLKGLDFIKTIKNPPQIIVTTAYHDYAVRSFELSVTDYLLKPIEFSRFVNAVNKVKTTMKNVNRSETLTIRSEKKVTILSIDEIIAFESQKEYIKVHTLSKPYLTKYPLSRIEDELDDSLFLRIHRSFIINLRHLKSFSLNEVEVNNMTIPIGGNYKATVDMRLRSLFDRNYNE